MIKVSNMSVKYPSGKGVFDIDFQVEKGKVIGYLGPNGAGKTTTIRVLMGFMKPTQGTATIGDLDCFKNAFEIKKTLGYIPGEIAFPSGMNCGEFIDYQCGLRGIKDRSIINDLMDRFELSQSGDLKKFSKGMKQKMGIVAGFMHDPDVLILDEPSSGLDPLMQSRFVDFILEQKKRGKTMLLSSHIYQEIERTCDAALIIKDGRLVAKSDIGELMHSKRRCYSIKTLEGERLQNFGYECSKATDNEYEIFIKEKETDKFIKDIAGIKIDSLDVKVQTLEEIFMNFYGGAK